MTRRTRPPRPHRRPLRDSHPPAIHQRPERPRTPRRRPADSPRSIWHGRNLV